MPDKEQKNIEWLRLLRCGDHAAFAEFVKKYQGEVFLCCRTLGLKEDEAEDAASETFLAAYNGLSRYGGRAELSTWLWSIAYRQAVNYLRKNHRHRELFFELGAELEDSKGSRPEAAIQHRENEEMVREAVSRLPRLWAMAVILYYRQDKTIKDIAAIMQMKENTVKTYLFRAKKRLRELLAHVLGERTDVGG